MATVLEEALGADCLLTSVPAFISNHLAAIKPTKFSLEIFLARNEQLRFQVCEDLSRRTVC